MVSECQIQLDLLRTLPNNQYYEKLNSDGIPRLRNVLLAFSLHKPDVGYCQVSILVDFMFKIYLTTAIAHL